MASWSAKEVCRALKKKGFEDRGGRKHRRLVLYVDGKITSVQTQVSRGSEWTLSRRSPVFKQIREQLRLQTNAQLEDLVQCPMSGADYVELLRASGVLP